MMQVEIDYHVVHSHPTVETPFPLIRMFCVTEAGHSVLANVYGYCPYLYVRAPAGFTVEQCGAMRAELEAAMRAAPRGNMTSGKCDDGSGSGGGSGGANVLGVEVLMSQSLMGYHGRAEAPFLKITVRIPAQIPVLRGLLESGAVWHGTAMPTYESNILFPLRFMVDTHITGCDWVRLAAGTYTLTEAARRSSVCQIEVDVNYRDVVKLGVEGEWSRTAPLRVLSFDIECSNRKGLFPEAKEDPVIQIANMVTVLGESAPVVRNIFTLGECSSIPNAEVLAYSDEREMLEAYRDFVVAADPDIIIGYNIVNFDIPYLVERAKALKIPLFSQWGRIAHAPMTIRDSHFSSKAYGTRESKEIGIDGRVPFDILQVLQRDQKLRSYTLNFVSATFLGEQKEDVDHSEISNLFRGTNDDRRRLAVYCLKDAYLPQRLADKLMILVNNIEMARVTGVPLGYLLPHGQQIKVLTQIYRKALEKNLRIPYMHRKTEPGEKYKGATVIQPVPGFHDLPVATLDFASLYPSIMIAHNICYSTLLPRDPVARTRVLAAGTATAGTAATEKDVEDQFEESPPLDDGSTEFFVKKDVAVGVLPSILRDLLDARKRAKADLARETDPARRRVLDGRQLALKISANSVYGVTGARDGKLPCTEIAATVTAYGREMIMLTRRTVEEHYRREHGFASDALVVYGDTDSVMVKFGEPDLAKVIALGKEAAGLVSRAFPPPVKLEFEKVYYPYLLISKKRYAGLLWTNPDKPVKIDTKGIETVRRDNCQLVKYVMDTCLTRILIDRDLAGAEAFVKSTIASLLQNRLDLSLLVISKALSKEGADYGAKQAHVELVRKMRLRDPATAPGIGDRVPYVIIQAAKGAKTYEKAEDPLYVLDKNIPLDYDYYIENQLRKPVTRIFKPIMRGDVNSLFSGDHTLFVTRTTPTDDIGGISRFVQKVYRCLACKAPLANGASATVCEDCRRSGRDQDAYTRQLAIVADLEQKYCRAWTQCQRCMDSVQQPILCTNRDCPIFYMRSKVRKDLQEAQAELDRFSSLSW